MMTRRELCQPLQPCRLLGLTRKRRITGAPRQQPHECGRCCLASHITNPGHHFQGSLQSLHRCPCNQRDTANCKFLAEEKASTWELWPHQPHCHEILCLKLSSPAPGEYSQVALTGADPAVLPSLTRSFSISFTAQVLQFACVNKDNCSHV